MRKQQIKRHIRKGATFVNRHTLEQCTVMRSTKDRRKGPRIIIERRITVPPYRVEREIPYHSFVQNYSPAEEAK